MRNPPDNRSKCRICGKLLGDEIGSIAWQCRDDDLCGYDKCYNEPISKVADLNRVFGNPANSVSIPSKRNKP